MTRSSKWVWAELDLIYKALYTGQYIHTVHTPELCQGRSHFRQSLPSGSLRFTAQIKSSPPDFTFVGKSVTSYLKKGSHTPCPPPTTASALWDAFHSTAGTDDASMLQDTATLRLCKAQCSQGWETLPGGSHFHEHSSWALAFHRLFTWMQHFHSKNIHFF